MRNEMTSRHDGIVGPSKIQYLILNIEEEWHRRCPIVSSSSSCPQPRQWSDEPRSHFNVIYTDGSKHFYIHGSKLDEKVVF